MVRGGHGASIRSVDSVSAAMSAILIPGFPTPSMLLPIAMNVAAWVSCSRFSVNISPLAVVTVSESGTGPR